MSVRPDAAFRAHVGILLVPPAVPLSPVLWTCMYCGNCFSFQAPCMHLPKVLSSPVLWREART